MVRLGMKFNSVIDEMFFDHHDDMGLGEDEILDLIEDSTIEQRTKWINRLYNLPEEKREFND
ncbi:hypothetical protein [Bacillus sp. Au-Bac7]|uniref:hypothetical protein n=1 Tax=Bacillus sp. Au-Bac7 TaxID=2906458 RepID=UPI001E34A967|nr:hypothetical protein [Bacillus sp. Au-Bac7]MCE4051876.1 hypothetical protein [Bacillus sp. Au-Bac7]